MAGPFDEGALATWRERGWILARGVLDDAQVAAAKDAVEEATAWAEKGDVRGLHHWEMTDDGPALARSEDLVPHQPDLDALIRRGPLLAMASQLLGEPAVLFKEKVNYKHPGGAGFAPHQDASAYRFAEHHVSCMLPVDVASVETGCLSVVSGAHAGFLPTDDGGRIEQHIAERLAWEPAELSPGDLLWFDSYTPHRSGTNEGVSSRRALYLTYNAASAGDHRDRYYADKRAEFERAGETFGDERVRVSITDDFLGRPVPRT